MIWKNNPRAGVLVLSVLLLSACANNETKPADEAGNATPTTTASATANGSKQAPAAPQELAVEIPNPATITFDKLSVKLDETGKQNVSRLAEKAKSSKKLEVWGFCDRNQIGNPVPCATQRAVAVHQELKANGVKTPVRIRYNTEKADAHAVEVWFH